MILQELYDKKLINLPKFLLTNTSYLTIMGSVAYATSNDTSDMDLYGFAVPLKEDVFPHLRGEIPGFGSNLRRFEQYQQHHVLDQDALGGKGREYDFTIFSIIKYFDLVMENNPNCIDSLFTPDECVIHSSQIANMVREKRHIFLHKGAFKRFKGYAMSQLHKLHTKKSSGKRKEQVEEFGFDLKYAMHLVRLLDECEQILITGDIDLRKNKEHHKAIRRGELSKEEILKWVSDKERDLETLYVNSNLPALPREREIKQLLLNCLEHHYGDLSNVVVIADKYKEALLNIKGILEDVRI